MYMHLYVCSWCKYSLDYFNYKLSLNNSRHEEDALKYEKKHDVYLEIFGSLQFISKEILQITKFVEKIQKFCIHNLGGNFFFWKWKPYSSLINSNYFKGAWNKDVPTHWIWERKTYPEMSHDDSLLLVLTLDMNMTHCWS